MSACGGGDDSGGSDGAKSVDADGLKGLVEDDSTPTPGGKVTFALGAETNGGWCLAEAQLAPEGIQVARAIYDTLTIPDDDGNYVPFLASAITSNDDFTEWTIDVRPGITFHNGEKLNAQVVKDNLDAYRGALPSREPLLFSFVFNSIESVETTGDMTVVVKLKSPWSAFPSHLYSYGRLGIMAEEQLKSGDDCFKKLIGTGPFEFNGDWTVNERLTVKKYANYWREDKDGNKLPYLDEITFRPITQTSTLVNGMQSKQYDLAFTDGTTAIYQLQQAGGLNIVESSRYPEVGYTIFNVAKEPFNNINARLAFVQAFNVEDYNRVRNHNLLQIANGPFGPGLTGYLKDTGYPTYNLQAAKDSVAKYKQETGKDLEFTYGIGDDADAQQGYNLLTTYMKAAGIKMSPNPVKQDRLIDLAISGDFQAQTWRNHPGFDPDDQWVWWHCDSEPALAEGTDPQSPLADPAPGMPENGNVCDNPVNFTRFNDTELNDQLEAGRVTDDESVRKPAYEAVNKEFAKQVWSAWSFWALWTVPAQKDIRGVLRLDLPPADAVTATGAPAWTGLAAGVDVAGLWKKQ